MASCDECGEATSMPYKCRFCGGEYCSKHRLPENHSCDGLSAYESSLRDEGKIYDDPSMRGDTGDGVVSSIRSAVPLTAFRGNMTYVLLAIMAVTFFVQRFFLVLDPLYPTGCGELCQLHNTIFVLSPAHIEYVWTWFTSIFAHGGIFHIFINGLVLYFFGTVVERRIGSNRFLVFFILTGAVAGLAQTVAFLLTVGTSVPGVVGASGAIMGLLGVLTILNPNLRVYLWFIVPMPLWVLTVLFAAYDFFMASSLGVGGGEIARLAHLSGLAIGLAYGWKLKRDGVSVRSELEFSGGGPGGRRPPRF